MKNFYYIYFFLFLGFMSCGDKMASIAGGYDLELGFTISFNDEDLKIHFDEVVADSRCPIGSNCGDAGEAIIQLVVTSNASEVVFPLATIDPEFRNKEVQTSFGKYRIEFIDLYPYPVLNQPLEELQSIVITLTEI